VRVFAFDPMAPQTPNALLGSAPENEVVLEVDYEPLEPGPIGRRVAVLDYDASHGCYYPPVDLDDPALAMNAGLDPNEADPLFHQQMVYAVVMKAIENFDRALGRRIQFSHGGGPFRSLGERLGIVPHAFQQTHALVHRLRPRFMEPTN
jgi:hypothetical protein